MHVPEETPPPPTGLEASLQLLRLLQGVDLDELARLAALAGVTTAPNKQAANESTDVQSTPRNILTPQAAPGPTSNPPMAWTSTEQMAARQTQDSIALDRQPTFHSHPVLSTSPLVNDRQKGTATEPWREGKPPPVLYDTATETWQGRKPPPDIYNTATAYERQATSKPSEARVDAAKDSTEDLIRSDTTSTSTNPVRDVPWWEREAEKQCITDTSLQWHGVAATQARQFPPKSATTTKVASKQPSTTTTIHAIPDVTITTPVPVANARHTVQNNTAPSTPKSRITASGTLIGSICKGCTCCLVLWQRQEHKNTVDKRIPVDVWHHIFQYLYPSQLSRVSQVSKTLYDVVEGMSLWRTIYQKGLHIRPNIGFGATLPKRLMSFIFACSFCICEQCFRSCDGENALGRLAAMPLPVPLKLVLNKSDSSYGELFDRALSNLMDKMKKYDSDHFDPNELELKVRLCMSCRKTVYEKHPEEHIPSRLSGSYLTKKELKDIYHLGDKSVQGILSRIGPISGLPTRYSEIEALKRARLLYGGSVGLQAVPRSLTKPMKQMNGRVHRYRMTYG